MGSDQPRDVSPEYKTCPACGSDASHDFWTVGDDSYACDRTADQPTATPEPLPCGHPFERVYRRNGRDICDACGADLTKPDPHSPPWEACKACGDDHWTTDHPRESQPEPRDDWHANL